MLIFGVHGGQRLTLEVTTGMTVADLKETIQEKLGISVDLYRQDKKVLVLSYAGADLGDSWVFSDLGIVPGTTIRVQLKEEVKPVLYIKCSHSQETISVYDNITIAHMKLNEVRSMASMKSGLPVGIFRLTTMDGREMFDRYRLEDYGIDIGHTICLENWDGWNEFLNLAIMGFTPQVLSQIGGAEVVARYQMKVALFIAAHFGHVDLARIMLRQGIRSDDPTGYHPARMWCKADGHIDSLKCPVHEATLCGQLGVLRLFVNTDITCLKAKDGYDLEPLNIALRRKIKPCASFLLTKQWSKVNITKTFALHLATYTRLKKWCDRAKESALLKYGLSKSTLRRRNFDTGPLVSHGVLVDGYSPSVMKGKSKAQLQKEEREKEKEKARRPKFNLSVSEILGSTEEPENYFKNVASNQNTRLLQGQGRLPPNRWNKAALLGGRASKAADELGRETGDLKKAVTLKSPVDGTSPEPRGKAPSTIADSEVSDDLVTKLPPIMQKMRLRLMSQSQPSMGGQQDVKDKSLDLQSGPVATSTSRLPKTDRDTNSKTDAAAAAAAGSSSGGGGGGGGKPGLSKLVKGKNAYFMASQSAQPTRSSYHLPPQSQLSMDSKQQQPPPSERSEKSKMEASAISVMSDRSGDANNTSRWKSHTAPSVTSTSSHTEEVIVESEPRTKGQKGKRRKRVSSALLLSKAKSSEGSIPLPLISHEQDRRPFFYHQGMREDDLVEPALELVSKYKGHSSRERAIKSLTLANAFTDKPWLGQVRIALNLSSNSLRRNVRRLRRNKRNLA